MSLQAVGESLWLADGGLVDFYGFPYPTRMVVARLRDGGLWVWSPIGLTPALERQVAALGRVAHLVSPNKLHHLFLGEWKRAYPAAVLWGPASTQRKRADLEFAEALTDDAPPAWRDEIAQCWFRGSPLLDEIVFFHRPSRTAILADLSENFSPAFLQTHWRPWQRVLARLWKMTVGHGLAPLEWRLSWLNRAPARAARDRLLAWQPERVIVAHGEWQPDHGLDYLRRVFAWLD